MPAVNQMAGKPKINVAGRLKDAQALELRKAGASYDQIAKQLGYAQKSGAHHSVMRALKAAMAERNDNAEAVIELELQRLDDMTLGLWQAARTGKWLAVDRVLAIMERRARMLGLDAPTRRELSGPDGGPIQVEQDVTYSVEERQRRILTFITERTGTGAAGFALAAGSDLDSAGGTADDSMADAG